MPKSNYVSYIKDFNKLQEHIQEKVLLKIGLLIENISKKLAPVDYGKLRQSIDNIIDMGDSIVYIGSRLEYAIYVEKGTGVYAQGGRRDTWVYYDVNRDRYYKTNGQEPQPFLEPAAKKAQQKIVDIIKSEYRKVN
jgi:HK97 gp10 family phage protein